MKRALAGISARIPKHCPLFIIAIDGRCASGKTTLAALMRDELSCTVIHMDDFFLQPHQRTEKRLSQAGENVDHERFLSEVLIPLRGGERFEYRPYDCHTQSFGKPISVTPCGVVVVEGSYCCHKSLWDYCDLHVFLSVDKDTQSERIISRNGAAAAVFRDLWIPLEEAYFSASGLRGKCELTFDL